MNFAQLLVGRLTVNERIKIRMYDNEDYLVGRYWDFHHELSGSKFRGGTVEQGIEEMREVRETVNAQFREAGLTTAF